MQSELTCSQVMALMNFYIENKLTPKLRGFVDAHLQHCEKCRKVYLKAMNLSKNAIDFVLNPDDSYFTPQYQEFKDKLSAYVDNELDEHDCVKMKKIVITNPMARKDLENMLNFKRLMHNSFNRSKNEWKNDYTRLIMKELGKEPYPKFEFAKIAYSFAFLITFALLGLLVMIKF